jgi:DNA recombination protein RmuC
MEILVPLLLLLLGLVAGVLVGLRWGRRDDRALAAIEARGEDQAVIRDGLERLHDRMRDLEQERVAWQGRLHQQVDDVRLTADQLRRETASLATALRKPQVRGRWGELHLRRTVELAGMVDHCDFEEQLHLIDADGARRPDLVVHLAGGRSIVVDSKVPLDAHLDALATDDEDERRTHLLRHARQLRSHVDALSAKAYWRALPCTPEFVVLFVPTESSLAAALDADPGLLEHAAAHNVVVATPTTLIALLRTVAHGWTTEALAESTREVHELGRDLHDRLGVLGGHLDKLGRALKGSVEAYNRTVGSLESRVLVTARQFEDIGVTREALPSPEPVREAPRPLTAAELLDAVAEGRPQLPSPDLRVDPGSGSDDRRTG